MTAVEVEPTLDGNQDSWTPNSTAWFESHAADGLRFRSHQQIVVVSVEPAPSWMPSTFGQRGEDGCPLKYRVRFPDGFQAVVFEDELLVHPRFFYCPSVEGPPC